MPVIFSSAVGHPQEKVGIPDDWLPKRLLLAALLLFILIPAVDSPSAHIDTCFVSIEGIHRFFPGDAPEWAAPEYDDAAWVPVRVPGSWQSQGLNSSRGMGWYRIHFSMPMEGCRSIDGFLGLSLGRIGNADEVFLNGRKVGGEGVVGDHYVEAPWKERLYRIPTGLLRFGGDNAVAVRVMNTYQGGGILSGPVCIGEYGQLLADCHKRELLRYILEVSILIIFAVSILAGTLLSLIGSREMQYALFTLFVLLCGITFALDSLLFYETGLKNYFAQRTITMLTFLVSGVGLWLLMVLCREPRRTWLWAIVASFTLIGLVAWFCSSAAAYWILVQIWLPLFLAALSAGVFLALRGHRRKLYEAGPILFGLIGLAVACLIEVSGVGVPVLQDVPVPGEYGVFIFFLGITWALLIRYRHVRRGFRVLSRRILDAQEDERKRLAREIHDGVGQPLLAVKLHLQMLDAGTAANAPIGRDALVPLISEVSDTIEELRNVAMDLRPAVLREGTLSEALRWYGSKFGEKTGLAISVHGDNGFDVPVRIKDHVYRIYQEALNNISKHASASLVGVQIERKGRLLFLTITDNGSGFDPARVMVEGQGIGLSTMKERAELLDGTLHVRSAPGKGTSIEIEVPLR